jgi:hypothetical protein
MRKLTPFDELACFCKVKPKLTIGPGTGLRLTAGEDCDCIAYPNPSFPKRASQYDAWTKAQKLKRTQFRVRGVVPDIPDVVRA